VSVPGSRPEPDPATSGLRNYTQAIYLLHTVSLVIGALGSAFIVTAFVFGLPSLVAVIMNYARRSEARGTWLESHFRWQIRSFWFALLWFVAATLLFGPLVLVGIGIPLLVLAYVAIGMWAAYRVLRGLLALRDARTLAGP
jgi:uncharacterized membrane protein